MSEPAEVIQPEEPEEAPKKRRGRRKGVKRKLVVVKPQETDELDGMASNKCCDACAPGNCVILKGWDKGKGFCGNPAMATHPTAPIFVRERIERAMTKLKHQRVR